MNSLHRHPLPESFFYSGLMIILMTLGIFSGCTKEGPAGPAGPGGDDDLMNPAIQPRVIATVPVNGSTGPYDLFNPGDGYGKPYFVLQANKLIDLLDLANHPASVTVQGFDRPVAIRIYETIRWPKTRKSIKDWPYDNILEFRIQDSLYLANVTYKVGQSYTITVDTSLTDINSNHLQTPYHFSYTPEPYFRVVSFSPHNLSSDVSRDSYLFIVFNSPVDTAIFSSLHINPAISGKWSLSSSDSLTAMFRLTQPLDYNTQYTISVDGNAHDGAGHLIHAADSSVFTTISFKVVYAWPANGSTGVYLGSTISLGVSGPMDTASARTAFSILPATPGYFYVSWTGLAYSPINGWNPNTDYTVTLSTALESSEGVHLAQPYHLTFRTDRFRVTNTYPSDGAVNVEPYASISVYFNGRIDTASGRSAVHISPSTPLSFWMGEDYVSFYSTTGFALLTTYTVTIDSTMRTKSGFTSGVPYSFSFKIRP